jgi:hypothetical protein
MVLANPLAVALAMAMAMAMALALALAMVSWQSHVIWKSIYNPLWSVGNQVVFNPKRHYFTIRRIV